MDTEELRGLCFSPVCAHFCLFYFIFSLCERHSLGLKHRLAPLALQGCITENTRSKRRTITTSSLRHIRYGIGSGFCSHSTHSGTEPGNVTRSPTRDRSRNQSRDVFAFTLKALRQFSGNFPGPTCSVKGAQESPEPLSLFTICAEKILILYFYEFLKYF